MIDQESKLDAFGNPKRRTSKELQEAGHALFEKLWAYRHTVIQAKKGLPPEKSDNQEGDRYAAQIFKQAGEEEMVKLFENPYELGLLCGRLAMVRWALGSTWKNLDT